MANSYNGEDFENGLLELSKEVFPTDDYLYQDGQYLDKDTINAYLDPKYTKSEVDAMDEDERKEKANENLGLNPSHNGETDPEKLRKIHLHIFLIFWNRIFMRVVILKGRKLKV